MSPRHAPSRAIAEFRRRRGLAAIALVAALAAVPAGALAQPPGGVVHPPRHPGESLRDWGEELFQGNCATCHGTLGRGATPQNPIEGIGGVTGYGPDLRGVGARAADFYLATGRMPLSRPDQQPERGEPDFAPAEIRALVAFVASLGKGPPIPDPDPGEGRLSQGLLLFTDNCAGCHQVVGEGGFVTDAKVPVLEHASSTQIAEAVRTGPYLMPRFSAKAISKTELDSIIAYVNASKDPDDAGGLGIGHIGPIPEGLVAWAVAGIVLVGFCVLIGKRVGG